MVEKRFSIDFCRQNKSIHQHQDSSVLLPAFILLSKLLCLLLDTPFCRDCDLIKDKSQCWKTAQKSRILIKIRMVVKKKMGQFILRSQGNPNSIGKVDQRKEIERTSIGLNFSSRKKSKMSLLTRELAYSLLSHKTSVCVPGEITTKNCSLWNPDNVAFPPSQSRHAYTRMSLMTRYVVHISYIFLGNSKSVLVYYQDCAK